MQIPETEVPRSPWRRLLSSSALQARRTPRCPEGPRLDGRLAVVTGATGGIGVEIARGLAARGADLILPCRDPHKGAGVAEEIRSSARARARIELVPLDLEDLDAARSAAREIERIADGRHVDLLVENAGLWPARPARTRQGHEIAFGVNLLAHFVLRRELLARGALRDGRVVVLTGDIYVLASECTPDYRWWGRVGGMRAYCRSKLGNLWIARELARRFPALSVYTVHPGVVATNLGGRVGPLAARAKRLVMISPELGAQMPLVCATQPSLENGGYYHNAFGLVRLPAGDPARDERAAARLWELCESLAAP